MAEDRVPPACPLRHRGLGSDHGAQGNRVGGILLTSAPNKGQCFRSISVGVSWEDTPTEIERAARKIYLIHHLLLNWHAAHGTPWTSMGLALCQ